MKESLERALLMAAGLALIMYAVRGPVRGVVDRLEYRRAVNCVNAAVKSIDLAVTNSLGGGTSDTYVYLPCEVHISCAGRSVTVTSGNASAGLTYPFELRCGGRAAGFGKFVSSWGERGVTVGWVGWKKG